jgi:hypothetical protein
VWENCEGICEQNKNGNYLLFCKEECIRSYFKKVSEMYLSLSKKEWRYRHYGLDVWALKEMAKNKILQISFNMEI